MWLWPVHKPWSFTPWGWLLAIVWNVCELCHLETPFAPYMFGTIIGKVPNKKEIK